MAQSPNDAHWPASPVANVVYWAQKSERDREIISATVFLNEQENRMKPFGVIDVAKARWATRWCRTLRLPVKEFIADRVVVIHCGWRVIGFRLIQRNKKQIGRD